MRKSAHQKVKIYLPVSLIQPIARILPWYK